MKSIVKVKKLNENAIVPKRATEGSAGADLYACITEPVTLNPGELVKIPTGIAIELEDKTLAAFLFAIIELIFSWLDTHTPSAG